MYLRPTGVKTGLPMHLQLLTHSTKLALILNTILEKDLLYFYGKDEVNSSILLDGSRSSVTKSFSQAEYRIYF